VLEDLEMLLGVCVKIVEVGERIHLCGLQRCVAITPLETLVHEHSRIHASVQFGGLAHLRLVVKVVADIDTVVTIGQRRQKMAFVACISSLELKVFLGHDVL